MESRYTQDPSNMDKIIPYIQMDKEVCIREIIQAKRCFFYDTCAFRKHANLPDASPILTFIKNEDAVVVITRTILMELASVSRTLNEEYILFLKKIKQASLKVLVLYEEAVFDVLSQCFSTNVQMNKFLEIALKVVKSKNGTISSVLDTDIALRTEIMSGDVADGTLFSRFFNKVRENKESGDDLGEEMIAACIHMLSNIPDNNEYKYIVLTEDKGAIRMINKARKNILEYLGVNTVTAVTTVALAQKLWQGMYVRTKEQIMEMFLTGNSEDKITAVVAESYDLEPQEKTMKCSELADKLMMPGTIHIYY